MTHEEQLQEREDYQKFIDAHGLSTMTKMGTKVLTGGLSNNADH